jgi:hypothetical protein
MIYDLRLQKSRGAGSSPLWRASLVGQTCRSAASLYKRAARNWRRGSAALPSGRQQDAFSNRQSSIVNRQSSIVNRQSSIVNRQL